MGEDNILWDNEDYQKMVNEWMKVAQADEEVSKELASKIKAKFSNAERIDHDRYTGGTTFLVGNVALSTKDEGNTFTITSIEGEFTQEELKPILLWATLEGASK